MRTNRLLAVAAFGLRLSFDPATLDWNMGDIPIHVINNVVEGLYEVNSKGDVVANEAAGFPNCVSENPVANDSQLKCTIKLKPGLKWSDGTLVTANDYVFSWKRLSNPKTGSSYRNLLKDFSEFKAADKSTIEYKSKSKDVSALTHWTTFPMREDFLAKKSFLYNGPYQISKIEPSIKYVMTPNAHHRKPGSLPLIHAQIVTDDSTALELYRNGKLHFISDLNTLEKTNLRKRNDYHKVASPVLVYLAVNTNHEALKSHKIRDALFHAIDRKQIPIILNSEDRPTENLTPFDSFKLSMVMKNDLKINGLELGYFEKGANRILMEFLHENFKTNARTSFILKTNEVKSYWAKLRETPYPVFLNTFGPAVWNEEMYYELLTSANPMNMGGFQDNAYDVAVKKGDFKTAKAILERERAIIPLYFRTYEYLLNNDIKGVELNPMTSLNLKNASWNKR